jgi:hypothetical protein
MSGYVDNTSSSPQQQEQVCAEKLRLLYAYKLAVEEHCKALGELNRKVGFSSRSQYAEMYRRAESLRGNTVILREELEWHVHKHGC